MKADEETMNLIEKLILTYLEQFWLRGFLVEDLFLNELHSLPKVHANLKVQNPILNFEPFHC
jgi:hypothetical protein